MRFLFTGSSVRNYVEAIYEMQVEVTAGPVGLLAQNVSTIVPPIFITTGNGTVLMANGFQPMLRLRQNEKVFTNAGVPGPSQPVIIETPPYDGSEETETPVTYSTVILDYSRFGSYHSTFNGSRSYAASYQDSLDARQADLETYLDQVTYTPNERNLINWTIEGEGPRNWTPEEVASRFPDVWAANSASIINRANSLRKTRVTNLLLGTTSELAGNPLRQIFSWRNVVLTLNLGNPEWPDAASTEAVSYSGRYQAFMRYVDKDENVSDPTPISIDVVLDEAPYILYSNLEAPNDQSIIRRQIFRNRDGSSDVFYLDIDTEDLTSASLVSRNTDTQLSNNFSQYIFDENNNNQIFLYGVPPSDKPYICEFNSVVFAAGFRVYRSGNAAIENGSATVQGIGTNWHEAFAGRKFIVDVNEYLIIACNPSTQEITLDRGYDGETDPYASYSIQPYYANSNLMNWSLSGYPEAWPIDNALQLPEDGDAITGLVTFANAMWILKNRSIYQFNYTYDPKRDGDYRIASQRGCVNQKCAVLVQNVCLMLDRIGVHVFKGQLPRYEYNVNTSPDHLSKAVGDLFRFETSGVRLNWNANTDFWHAAHNQELCTIRFYVAMEGYDLPYHALCYDYMMDRWWVESYPFPVSSSSNSLALQGRPVVGGQDGLVYQPDNGPLDLIVPNGSTRLGVSEVYSSVAFVLDGTPPDCIGTAIAITAGRGRGQWSYILDQDGPYIEIDAPFTVQPDDTSEIQIGAIPYLLRTGTYDYPRLEQSKTQAFSLGYNQNGVDLETYIGIEIEGNQGRRIAADAKWGAVSSELIDASRYKVDLSDAAEEATINMDKAREMDIPRGFKVSAIVEGFSGEEKPEFTDMAFAGAV